MAFLSGYDGFEYAKAGIEDEIVAYLLKPISMAELTEELRKIHDKIEKRLASLTRPQGGAEALRMVTATMLLDEYARPEPSAAAESLRSAGMEIRGDEHIVVAAFSLPDGAHPELLPMAERIFSRAFSCCGFSSGDPGRCFCWPPATGSGGCMRHWTSCGRLPAGHGAGKRWRA